MVPPAAKARRSGRSPEPASDATRDVVPPDSRRHPLYQQVVEALRRDILDGVHVVGALLPTEAELAAKFSVSRHTVREALRQLRQDGLVASRQGAGTVVTNAAAPQAFVHEVGAISDLTHYAAAMTFRVERVERLQLDADLGARLQAPVGSKWLRISGRRHLNADGGLVCLTIVHVPAQFAGIARLVGKGGGAIYDLIESLYGVRIGEVEQTVRVPQSLPSVVEALGLEIGERAIEVTRIYRLHTGETAEVAVNLYPPERFNMTMTLRSKRSD